MEKRDGGYGNIKTIYLYPLKLFPLFFWGKSRDAIFLNLRFVSDGILMMDDQFSSK